MYHSIGTPYFSSVILDKSINSLYGILVWVLEERLTAKQAKIDAISNKSFDSYREDILRERGFWARQYLENERKAKEAEEEELLSARKREEEKLQLQRQNNKINIAQLGVQKQTAENTKKDTKRTKGDMFDVMLANSGVFKTYTM